MPADFYGINSYGWPFTGDPAPAFPFGHFRTHSSPPVHWEQLNPADGVYDWTNMDILDAALPVGVTIQYQIADTPQWLARQDMLLNGPWNTGLGSPSPPQDLSKIAPFIAALLARYPRITVVQVGNEPGYEGRNFYTVTANAGADTVSYSGVQLASGSQVFFTTTGTLPGGLSLNTLYYTKTASLTPQVSLLPGGAAVDITSAGTGVHTMWRRQTFWWGTDEEFVDFAAAAYNAVKAANPAVKVISPGLYNVIDTQLFLDAVGPVSGLRGVDIPFDGLATHPYQGECNTRTFLGNADISEYPQGGIFPFQKFYLDRDKVPPKPYITEWGLQSSGAGGRKAQYLALSPAEQRQYMARLGIAAARFGVQQIAPFAYNHPDNISGDLVTAGGGGDGIGDAFSLLAGKTLRAGAGYRPDGTEVGVVDGVTYEV